MNGRKAKALRRAAGLESGMQAKYAATNTVNRIIPVLNKQGMPVLDQEGKPMSKGTFQTHTLILDQCARQVYQVLKSVSKGKKYA